MELKKNETDYTSDYETEKEYPNPNDALFGKNDLDTPYQVTGITTTNKKANQDMTKIISIVVAVVVCIGVIIFGYYNRHKYDGKYELIRVVDFGISYTVAELEENSGMAISASLDINGKNCFMEYDYTYTSASGNMMIEFDGNDITLKAQGEVLHGKYNSKNKNITITLGTRSLIFEKVD